MINAHCYYFLIEKREEKMSRTCIGKNDSLRGYNKTCEEYNTEHTIILYVHMYN